jgi:hypothetical protein
MIPAAVLLTAVEPGGWKECSGDPHGLKACTWVYPLDGIPEPEATKLAVYRHGRLLWSTEGKPFIWDFVFLNGGAKLAYATGPMHFGMNCYLVSSGTGTRIDSFDCYHHDEPNWPQWVRDLLGPRDERPEPKTWREKSGRSKMPGGGGE